ncbi:hypothetical protein [Legionella impletisoli]|uniref:Ankyrin repeats (3 copies) n=1 Tax=Legionella impletisoli TaxID=343510 RepID=A0A917N967_9GAMM|nr:hypothetical protein [Legionella impletisoli]GGI78835.1 hypothetical protein GCM10007966_04270 [Legionella impletisoli]
MTSEIEGYLESESEIAARLGVHLIEAIEKRSRHAFLYAFNALRTSKASIIYKALSSVSIHSSTPLMLAAKFSESFLRYLFLLLEQLSQKEQAEILMHSNHHGDNALLLTIKHNSSVFFELLSKIETLDKSYQHKIIQQLNERGDSALELAMSYYPLAVSKLLSMTLEMDESERNKILSSTAGYDLLWLVVRYCPSDFFKLKPMLQRVATLDKMLLQSSSNGWNSLMIALNYNRHALLWLLPMIEALDNPDRAQILKQKNDDGETPLFLAFEVCPEEVPTLEQLIRTLDSEDRIELYGQVLNATLEQNPQALVTRFKVFKHWEKDKLGLALRPIDRSDVLILSEIIRNQPKDLVHILSMTKLLSEEDQATYMMPINPGEDNALLLAASCQPRLVPHLLEVVNGLSLEVRKRVFDSMTTLDKAKPQNKEHKSALQSIKDARKQCNKEYDRTLNKSRKSNHRGFFSRGKGPEKTVKGRTYTLINNDDCNENQENRI